MGFLTRETIVLVMVLFSFHTRRVKIQVAPGRIVDGRTNNKLAEITHFFKFPPKRRGRLRYRDFDFLLILLITALDRPESPCFL